MGGAVGAMDSVASASIPADGADATPPDEPQSDLLDGGGPSEPAIPDSSVDPMVDADVEPPPDADVEPPPDADVEPPPDADVEPPPDADVEPPCEPVPSERLRPVTCTSTHPDLPDACERTVDEPESSLGMTLDCNASPEACDFETGTCTPQRGCIKDFTLMYALAQERTADHFRFHSDWWSKRPREWELWASSDESITPDSGATLVLSGTGRRNPWVCVAGESCASSDVPDVCCPDGRDAPQNPPNETTPKYDESPFVPTTARVWWFRVVNTYDTDTLMMFEVELFSQEQTCP